jgi:hypothetical protein
MPSHSPAFSLGLAPVSAALGTYPSGYGGVPVGPGTASLGARPP